MKAVILAGGLGTRLSEETATRPKPMVEVGGRPILWHILKIYSEYEIQDFVICAGYKGYMIKEYFANYFLHMSDVTFDIQQNTIEVHKKRSEAWRVTVVDTGDESMTGGRIKRIAPYIDDTFCMTYGDGVADVNIGELVEFHKKQGTKATLTAVQPSGRFGALDLDGDTVKNFEEKPQGDGAWINGGFFVLEPGVFDYIEQDSTVWERAPMENLAKDGEISAYKHHGYWQPMDTLGDRNKLQDLWDASKAPWKVWR